MADTDYANCMEIVEEVMEMIARRWTNSMIKRELREWFPGLSGMTCHFVIGAAKKEIRKRFNIDPHEYKGKQIQFYEYIIRSKSKMRDKLTAAERLDKLLGLETLSDINPDTLAAKIREAVSIMDNSIGGIKNNEKDKGDDETNTLSTKAKDSGNEGQSEVNAKDRSENLSQDKGSEGRVNINEKPENTVLIEDIEIPKETLDELNNLKKDSMNDFRKRSK